MAGVSFAAGFCECGAEYGGMVLYFDCGHDLMTCNQACLMQEVAAT
jgi:hypothetical protein